MSGIELIAAERQRQLNEEGWTPEHDDEHNGAEMIDAAAEYARYTAILVRDPSASELREWETPSGDWPWHPDCWKPDADPIRNLVKAGALIAAEIDRLERKGGVS